MSNAIPKSRLQFTAADVELWRRIAFGSALVCHLSRRPYGFWSYPTDEPELEIYYGNRALEGFDPSEHGSYTITWNALVALERLYGTCPPAYLRDIQRIFAANRPIDGAYGRPVPPSKKEKGDVIKSARHTAFALLIRLRFLPLFEQESWIDSVLWLLEKQTRTKGWTYRVIDGDDEPVGTAACVAALCLFAQTETTINQKQKRRIDNAISDGFERLLTLREPAALWKGFLPGKTDVLDSAFIIELLTQSGVAQELRRRVAHSGATLAACRDVLLETLRHNGWPSVFAPSAEASLSSSIGVLGVFANLDAIETAPAKLISNQIASDLVSSGGGSRLDSWDWMNLARLSATLLSWSGDSVLSETDNQNVVRISESLQGPQILIFRLARIAYFRAPAEVDDPILFLLGKGTRRNVKVRLACLRWVFAVWPVAAKWLGRLYFFRT